MPSTDPSLDVRPCTSDDAAAVVELVRTDEELFVGRPSRLGPADILAWWAHAELGTDSWLVSRAGRPVAVAWMERRDDLVTAVGIVAVGAKGQGIGARLVDIVEDRSRDLRAGRIHQLTVGADRAAATLLTARGYQEIRHFYDMAIELDGRPEPVVPPGFEIDPVRADEVETFHAVVEEAFADHWEHHGVPFEEWWQLRESDPDLDLALWFVARHGSEIVGVARNEANRNGGGYVATIGVRRPWRGRGLARALLLQSFAAFHDRGVRLVTLSVDAQNPSGATELYRSTGMHVDMEMVAFDKSLPAATAAS